jgi:MFS family permease
MLEKLHISNKLYSMLYFVYAWTNCAMVLFAGALIDKTTNRGCALLFTTVAFVGQTVLSIGVQLSLFPLMVVGRTIFGMGLGSICVAQNVISNTYFRDRDLATAFAATLTVSRIGSVTNFFLSTRIYGWFGESLPVVFWWGTIMTALSLLAAVGFFLLDLSNEKAGNIVSAARKSRKIKWSDVMKFPPIYWVLCFVCSLYYINTFCLMAVMVNYLELRNGYDSNTASMIASTIYFVAIPCVPFFGRLIDYYGHRMHWLALSVFVMIPFNIYFGWTEWTPIPVLVVAGASYSMVASCLWPSLFMVVPDECTGTANGICTSIQMIGIGSSNLIIGALRDSYTYRTAPMYLLACSSVAFGLTLLSNWLDDKLMNGILNTHAPLAKKSAPPRSVQASDEKTPLVGVEVQPDPK